MILGFAGAFVEHDHVVDDDFSTEFFLAFFVFPTASFEITFDINQFSLFEVFVADFAEFSPSDAFVEFSGFFAFAVRSNPFTVRSDAETDDHLAALGSFHFRIASKVSD